MIWWVTMRTPTSPLWALNISRFVDIPSLDQPCQRKCCCCCCGTFFFVIFILILMSFQQAHISISEITHGGRWDLLSNQRWAKNCLWGWIHKLLYLQDFRFVTDVSCAWQLVDSQLASHLCHIWWLLDAFDMHMCLLLCRSTDCMLVCCEMAWREKWIWQRVAWVSGIRKLPSMKYMDISTRLDIYCHISLHAVPKIFVHKRVLRIMIIGLSPLPVIVTTRIVVFLVGDPYKPSFATVTGRGDNPMYYVCVCTCTCSHHLINLK